MAIQSRQVTLAVWQADCLDHDGLKRPTFGIWAEVVAYYPWVMDAPHRIVMLAYAGCQVLDVAGPLQMFARANLVGATPEYEIIVAAAKAGPFATNSGIQLVSDVSFENIAAAGFTTADTVIAAGGDKGLSAALADGKITALVRLAAARGARIISVCSGAFFLAAAGVLDGRRAATHWDSVDRLRHFHPGVRVDPESIYVRDGDIWTSAGVTAGIDLALALIASDHGDAVALAVARDNVVFPIRPGGQSQFSSALAACGVRDRRLARLVDSVTRRPDNDWRSDALAAEAGVSLRSLSRLFRRELNDSPSGFVERVRIDKARRALLEGNDPIEKIAIDCGFGSARRMDRAFIRVIAATPSDFRARFRLPRSHSLEKGHVACPLSASAS